MNKFRKSYIELSKKYRAAKSEENTIALFDLLYLLEKECEQKEDYSILSNLYSLLNFHESAYKVFDSIVDKSKRKEMAQWLVLKEKADSHQNAFAEKDWRKFKASEEELKNLPHFTYSPNAYDLDLFEKTEGRCSVCEEERSLKYKSSFYSIDKPDYICPWCIANGKAAEKYNGSFNDYLGIEGVSPDPNDPPPNIPEELLLAITDKTPSYLSCQQEQWLTHCQQPCAFIGYADTETIQPLLDELKEDIEQNIGIEPKFIKENLSKDGHLIGYLFRCLKCNQHRLHADCT